jgi:hypothetical protein
MGKLTIEIPDGTHLLLKVIAANRGITIKDYVLEKLLPELDASRKDEPSLTELAAAWEERRKDFKLERGEQSLRDVIHEGHKW